MNAGALLARMNFALALASGRCPACAWTLAALVAAGRPRAARRRARPPARAWSCTARPAPATRAVLRRAARQPGDHAATADDRGTGEHRRRQARGAGARLARVPAAVAMHSLHATGVHEGGRARAPRRRSTPAAPRFLVRAAPPGAGEPAGKVLVAVFQRGAVDGLSMVVPHGDADYYAARTTIALEPPAAAERRRRRRPRRLLRAAPGAGAAQARSGTRAAWRWSTPADRRTPPARTSTRRTTWRPARQG